MKRLTSLIMLLLIPGMLFAAERAVPEKTHPVRVRVSFNDETITGQYLYLDLRTNDEKAADAGRGMLDGPVTVFFHGHAQRPADTYDLTSRLAHGSRSGILVVPVVDTPYGRNPAWRGDAGKDVILMEMVRYVLALHGMTVDGAVSPGADPVLINGEQVEAAGIPVKLNAVGWSHGGILARRFCSAHPAATVGLAQVCPAGYGHWGVPELGFRFAGESLRIGTLAFKGHADAVMDCTWGFTKGAVGDTCRSWGDAVGALMPVKAFRNVKDARDCAMFVDDSTHPLRDLHNVVVIFGLDDSCIRASQTGVSNPAQADPAEVKAFWQTFFPGCLSEGTHMCLRFLPGTHCGPATHSELFAGTVLDGLGETEE